MEQRIQETGTNQEAKNNGKHKYILEKFLDCYLTERDAQKTLSLVTDDIYSLGTGVQEVAHNKEELSALIYSELEQLSMPITYVLDSYCEKEISPEAFVCLCDVTSTIEMDDHKYIHYVTRLTSGFRMVDGTYLAYHLHMSEASALQDDCEFFPLHYNEVESHRIDADDQINLIELMKKMLPGGAMGGYVESGFPLYFINDELLAWLGYTYEEFIAENGQQMSNTMHPDDVDRVEETIAEAFHNSDEYTVEYRMRKKDGTYIWVRDIGRKTIATDGRMAMVSIIADISAERKRLESFENTIETLKKERRVIDRLTGLLNREPAESLIKQHLVHEKTGAFFLMDIDNFKLVNDAKGHPVGDQVLRRFGSELKNVFPESGVIARFGGDEFIVFLPQYEKMEQLECYAEQVLAKAMQLLDDPLLASRLGASIGIALAPQDGEHFTTLYASADKAQYYAKRNGKGRYSFYNEQSPIVLETDTLQLSLDTLRRMVRYAQVEQGAFSVEYEAFAKVCQFMERNASRMEYKTQIVLFSLKIPEGYKDNPQMVREKRTLLEGAIRYALRNGDLMMVFSPSQVVAMFVNCDSENVFRVAQRILKSYSEQNASAEFDVTYESFDITKSILV